MAAVNTQLREPLCGLNAGVRRDPALGSAVVNQTRAGCDPRGACLPERIGLRPSGEGVSLEGWPAGAPHSQGTVRTDPVPAERGLCVIAEKHLESLKRREHTF